ncbi:MAG: hypothetical protein DLM63_00915 [Solirubrobacterales bacterium]|nr:MAG: hypothetical protein DLM63_00915 [Solirubrobacterales bacterium]
MVAAGTSCAKIRELERALGYRPGDYARQVPGDADAPTAVDDVERAIVEVARETPRTATGCAGR